VDAERIIAAASGRVDGRLLDDLHTVAADHARRMHTEAPRDLLPHVEHHLAYVHGLLCSPQPPAQQARLHLVGGTLAAVAGRLAFRLGNPGDAHARYMTAEGHAQEAGEGPLRAYVLGQRSHLCSDLWDGRQSCGPWTALELLDEAHAAAGAGSSAWLRSWLWGRRAKEHAARADARAAHEDLDQAERVLSHAEPDDTGLLAHWQDAALAHLATYRGSCAQLLGDTKEATTAIEDALGGLSPSLVGIRSSVMTDLAAAYAREEKVEHACQLLTQSLELSADAGLVAHVQRAVKVRRHLARWQDAPAVRELDDRLRSVTWAPV
jgi:tetratricopeptide (TPR) repeat protein